MGENLASQVKHKPFSRQTYISVSDIRLTRGVVGVGNNGGKLAFQTPETVDVDEVVAPVSGTMTLLGVV